jgi:hypothetical protein
MNLYLISQTDRNDYDTYDSAVVAAENEEDARKIHPGEYEEWTTHSYRTWASSPDLVTVRLIGQAAPGIETGVVLASFNAG